MSQPGGPSAPGGSDGWSRHDPHRHGPSHPDSRHSGHGQYQGMRYEGFGVYESTRPAMPMPTPHDRPPRRRRGFVITTLSLGVSVLVIAVISVIWVTQPRDEASSTPPPASTDSTTPTSEAETPSVAGWQAISVPRRGAVYDAPSSWTRERSDNVIAFGPPDNAITMTGVTVYKKGFCAGKPNSYRAIAGATAREGSDDREVATATLDTLTNVAFPSNGPSPRPDVAPPEQVELDQGKASGIRVTATVTNPDPDRCEAPRSLVSVLARNNDGNRSVVHVAIAEQGVSEAFPPQDLATMMESFRPGS